MLGMMEKHGITMGDQVIVDDTVSPNGITSHLSSILDLARLLVGGMSHFYPSPLMTPRRRDTISERDRTSDVILRTGKTPWSGNPELVDSTDVDTPYFTPFKSSRMMRPWMCRWDTHSEKEQIWLEAFVEIYRYLKGLD